MIEMDRGEMKRRFDLGAAKNNYFSEYVISLPLI
jgi:hypothetical protein